MEIYGKTGAKHKSNISLKEKLSNYLLEAVLAVKYKIKILQGESYGHKSSAVGKTKYSGFTANLQGHDRVLQAILV